MSKNKKNISYTTIYHKARVELNININEYIIADYIHRMGNHRKSKYVGWCYAKKETIAEGTGVSSRTVYRSLNTLKDVGLIKQHPKKNNFLQSTSKWFETVEKYTECQVVTSSVTSCHTETDKLSHPSKNNKESKREKERRSKKYLLNVPREDIKKFIEDYNVDANKVVSKGEDLHDWCQTEGKKKKNYYTFLQGALRKDYGKRVKPEKGGDLVW